MARLISFNFLKLMDWYLKFVPTFKFLKNHFISNNYCLKRFSRECFCDNSKKATFHRVLKLFTAIRRTKLKLFLYYVFTVDRNPFISHFQIPSVGLWSRLLGFNILIILDIFFSVLIFLQFFRYTLKEIIFKYVRMTDCLLKICSRDFVRNFWSLPEIKQY